MLIVELVILCVLFWGICCLNTGSDDKNIKSYASYPDEVQEMVKKNPALQSKIKKKLTKRHSRILAEITISSPFC